MVLFVQDHPLGGSFAVDMAVESVVVVILGRRRQTTLEAHGLLRRSTLGHLVGRGGHVGGTRHPDSVTRHVRHHLVILGTLHAPRETLVGGSSRRRGCGVLRQQTGPRVEGCVSRVHPPGAGGRLLTLSTGDVRRRRHSDHLQARHTVLVTHVVRRASGTAGAMERGLGGGRVVVVGATLRTTTATGSTLLEAVRPLHLTRRLQDQLDAVGTLVVDTAAADHLGEVVQHGPRHARQVAQVAVLTLTQLHNRHLHHLTVEQREHFTETTRNSWSG